MCGKYSSELKAALGFMVLQFLFKITFELEGAQRVPNLPVIYVVYVFILMLIAAIILSTLKQKSGYILGVIYGVLNVVAALFMIVSNNLPAGNSPLRPINVIVTSLLIGYFCFRELWDTIAREV
jgi:hypothetical protein